MSNNSCNKAPPLDILEEAFETAGGYRHREANTLGTIGPPGVRTKLRQKNQITRCKNEGKIRRPNDCLALDQFKNLILPVTKMSRRPEAGRSAIVKNGELPPAVGGANPDARLLAPRCPRHNARRCCSIDRDRARSGRLGGHACSFLPLMRDRRSRQQMATYFDGVMAPLRGSSRSNLPTFIRAALFDDPCRISIGVAQNCLWQERSLCCVGGWPRERPKTTASVHLYWQRIRTL